MPTLIPNPPRCAQDLLGRELTWRERWELRARYAGAGPLLRYAGNRIALGAVVVPLLGPLMLVSFASTVISIGLASLADRAAAGVREGFGLTHRFIKPMNPPWHLKPGERGRDFMRNERALQALKDMKLVDDRRIEEARHW